MNKKQAKKRIEKLRKEIRKHRYKYHVLDEQDISEEALDSLKKELFDLEQEYPDLITEDSPTQRVGGEPIEEFEKVEHVVPMLSFNDAFNEEDLKDWIGRVSNHLGYDVLEVNDAGFYCELKFDGLALELVYSSGSLEVGATRGDGQVGEDVTENVKTIESVPLRLRDPGSGEIPDQLVVRGEVLLRKEDFVRINKERKNQGKEPYANPRNVAAGTIRQLDPKVVADRDLDFFGYDIAAGKEFGLHSQEHEFMRKLGFKTDTHSKRLETLEEVVEFRNEWKERREELPYEIDGIVVQINDNEIFEEAGVVGKAPRGSIAFKFPPKEATTVVEDIKVNVGKTGAITPVAKLRPVEVGGVTISQASLHNYDQIQRLGVKIGDTVVVSRAGDVIPQVTEVLDDMRDGSEEEFEMPKKCPVDGSKVVKDGAIYRCSNPECGARNREQMYHLVSRGAFNIEGVGPKVIDRFLEEGLMADGSDLFTLEKGDIAVLEGFGEKSAENIVSEIEESSTVSLDRFLYSLGILHVGEETSVLLAKKIVGEYEDDIESPKDVAEVMDKISLGDLEAIEDIGSEVASSIKGWFDEERNKKFLEELSEAGVEIKPFRVEESEDLKDKKFVFTGSLDSMTRKEAKSKVRQLGGDPNSSVSSETDYVVVGENPGSKREEAEKLGVKIIDESQFLDIINSESIQRLAG